MRMNGFHDSVNVMEMIAVDEMRYKIVSVVLMKMKRLFRLMGEMMNTFQYHLDHPPS